MTAIIVSIIGIALVLYGISQKEPVRIVEVPKIIEKTRTVEVPKVVEKVVEVPKIVEKFVERPEIVKPIPPKPEIVRPTRPETTRISLREGPHIYSKVYQDSTTMILRCSHCGMDKCYRRRQ